MFTKCSEWCQNYLQLSNHSRVVVAIFSLSSLQFEGAAKVSQPFELRDILQFAIIHLKKQSHIQVIYSSIVKLLYTAMIVIYTRELTL